MQIIKSPLRYPGGKSRALQQIKKYIPTDLEEFREPFVGGGTLFIYIRQRFPKIRVWINDLNYELYSFWVCARDQLDKLSAEVMRVKKTEADGRKLFYALTNADVSTLTQLERAVRFFVLNRISFSGTVESGGYSEKAFHSRFTLSSIERLESLADIMCGVKITNFDYGKVIHERGEHVFIFLDPPYYTATNSRLYGRNGVLHTTFDHDLFAREIKTCPHQWLITYDDSPKIRKNLAFATQISWSLQYGMNNYKQATAEKGNELFIANFPIAGGEQATQMRLLERKTLYKARQKRTRKTKKERTT